MKTKKPSFPLALDIGSGSGYIYRAICSDDAFTGPGGIGGVRKLVQLDSSDILLHRDEADVLEGGHRCDTYRLCTDEEGVLPFPDGTFDLVLSSQSMHWVNDLPGLFREVKVCSSVVVCASFAIIQPHTRPFIHSSSFARYREY